MKRKRQQDQKRKQRSWFQRSSTGGLRSLAKNSWRECPPERFGTIQ